MTTRAWSLFLVAAVALGAAGCADTYGGRRSAMRVGVAAEYGTFRDYHALAPYGTWVAASYGWAWRPLNVGVGWRPYTVGRWAYTDWGWMWLSDDPWGALPYHYGRWAHDDLYGWVWLPGDVWGPAWVSWRYGADWVGWAPLPPDLGWQVGFGFSHSSRAIDARTDPLSWCFVPTTDFLSTRVGRRVLPPSRNVTILRATKNVTRYEDVRSRPAERGLRPDWISRRGLEVPRHRLIDASSPSYRMKPAVRGRDITINRGLIPETSNHVDLARANPPMRQRAIAPRRSIERQRKDQAEALRQRHAAEQRAQYAREDRMRRAFERRQERIERGQSRGRGQERNRS